MKQFTALGDVLTAARSEQIGMTFIGKKMDSFLSYEQLYQDALTMLYILQCRGVQPGNELIIQIDDQQMFITCFWAAILGGFIPVPITAGGSEELKSKLFAVWKLMKEPYLFAPRQLVDGVMDEHNHHDEPLHPRVDKERVIVSDEMKLTHKKGGIYKPESSNLAFIQFSSGSTGDPKGVMLTHHNLLTNMRAILECSKITAQDRSLSWMPLTHDMGLIGLHLCPVMGGVQQYMMSTATFVQKPMLWLQKADEYRITLLASPNFGYKHFMNYFKPEAAGNWDLSCVKKIYNGAEPISAALCHQFMGLLEPFGLKTNAMFPVYGMAEAGLAVTFPPIDESLVEVRVERDSVTIGQAVRWSSAEADQDMSFVDVGYPVTGCEVRIASEHNRMEDEGVIGQIQIRGDNVTAGYYHQPSATSDAITKEGWLNTGDLGFMHEGRLIVTGRIKDILFINGSNIYPHDIENIAASVSGAELGKIAACGVYEQQSGTEQLVIFLIHRGKLEGFASLAEQVKKQVNRVSGIAVSQVLPVRQIPKTTSGKIQRYKLTIDYDRGEFIQVIEDLKNLQQSKENDERIMASGDETSAVSMSETERVLSRIWQEVLSHRSIRLDDHFFEHGGQSLKAMQMLAGVQIELGIDVPVSQLFNYPTIREFAQFIDQGDRNPYEPLERVMELAPDLYTASTAQQRLFIQQQTEGIATSYNIPSAVRLEGKLDFNSLANAFIQLIERHEPLRTSFEWYQGNIVQRIQSHVDFQVEKYECADSDLEHIVYQFIRPFQLEEAPLIRAAVVRCDEELHYLLVDVHHIVCDGISLNLLLQEWTRLYQKMPLPALNIQYRDYAHYERTHLSTEQLKKMEAYWLEQLSGELTILQLPLRHVRGEQRTFVGENVRFKIPQTTVARLQNLTQQENSTLYAGLFSLYLLVLSRYTGQEELIVGSLVAGRTHPDTLSLLGMFNNYLPVRSEIPAEVPFKQYIKTVNKLIFDALDHQELPFDKMIELTDTQTERTRNPLFDTMFILHNQTEAALDMNIGELKLTRHELDSHTAKLDLKLDVFPGSEGVLDFIFEYNVNLLNRELVESMAAHFRELIEAAIAQPNSPLSELDMLTDTERKQLLYDYNDTEFQHPQVPLIHETFSEKAFDHPDRPAVIMGKQHLTYGELNDQAERLAGELQKKGVKRDTVVGIAVERSFEMMIGILAILKAGGAYLPISPQLPLDRINYMLQDSGAILLLTERTLSEDLLFSGEVLDLRHEALYSNSVEKIKSEARPDSLAYVIYTSGSTGKPKGVMIEHRALMNRLQWMQKCYPLGSEDVILQKTPITFDVSVWEVLWWTLAGSAVSLLPPDGEKDPQIIAEAIDASKVTTLHFVPSMLHMFLQHLEQDQSKATHLVSVRNVFASGEALHGQHAEQFYKIMPRGANLINLYGPTEAAIDVSYFECSSGPYTKGVPIGKPIDNIQLYIVDQHLQPQPIGVAGELCISGHGLARGYVNRPDLTADKFVSNPFVSGERMYRTGDLVRWNNDGQIEYIGRMDNQVKIRGYRIELGEIETVLLQHEAVLEAVVAIRHDRVGDLYLAAYIISNQERDISAVHWKQYLAQMLPEYMVPAQVVQLSSMPLTENGKIDRKALPEPLPMTSDITVYTGARNDTERKLVKMWREVLGAGQIGIDDHFFELGGQSLKAASLMSMIHKQFHVVISLRECFSCPTIRQLATLIENKKRVAYTPIKSIEKRQHYPVTSAQKRLYILHKIEATSTSYNLPAMIRLSGPLNEDQLLQAFHKLIERHEMLRTSFAMLNGEPVQHVDDQVEFRFEAFSLDNESEKEHDSQVEQYMLQFVRPFDLEQSPLLRGGLVKISEQEHILLFDMHHMIADGLSSVIVAEEIMSLYSGTELTPLSVQYKDYSEWKKRIEASDEMKSQEQYWVNQLSGEIPVLQLPTDRLRPSIRSYQGDQVCLDLEGELLASLRRLANETNTTLYMVLLASFYILLARYSGQEDIVIGTPAVGRSHPDAESLIGMFVNTLAVRIHSDDKDSFKQILQEVRRSTIEAFDHQDYPFEKLVEQLDVQRDVSRNPLFDVLFVLQQTGISGGISGGLIYEALACPTTVSKFDLTLEVIEHKDLLNIRFEYSTALFLRGTMERFIEQYVNILKSVIKQPDIPCLELALLTSTEKVQILEQFNDTAFSYPEGQMLHIQFEEQALLSPKQTAVQYGDRSLTYQQLNEQANRLARTLKSKGMCSDKLAAIMLERSPEMMISILAVLKAGGAYLPISPDYPLERIVYMLEDSEAEWLLTETGFRDVETFKGERLYLDDLENYAEEGSNLNLTVKPDNLAYVIYTSGSTGNPKGTMIEHQAVMNRINWMQRMYPLDESDVILQKTPFTFDVSVWELFWWFFAGSSVCFLHPGEEKNPQSIVDEIERRGITTMHFVPSMLHSFLEDIERKPDMMGRLSSLKRVFTSGEALHSHQVSRFYRLLSNQPAQLYNLYGPTEAAIDVSYFHCTEENISSGVPIGLPIDNIQLYIVNQANQLQPIGAVGELCISGIGLARGYLNREDLTQQKFVPNPFHSGHLMYRTGDLARWRADGNIEYLGRTDHQVKVRGYRIECGEIENCLRNHPRVKECIVMARKAADGNMSLCAYVVTDEEDLSAELRGHVSTRLPAFMIPAHFVQLSAIPLTANGKLDRNALPAPEYMMQTNKEYDAPANQTEKKLIGLWQELLGTDRFGTNDAFFEIGGHSLLVIRMHAQIEEWYPNAVKITDLFAYTTISKLAEHIDKTFSKHTVTVGRIELPHEYGLERGDPMSLSSFSFEVDSSLTGALLTSGERYKAGPNMIMLSLYVYLLAQVTKSMHIPVQVVQDENHVLSINSDLSGLNDFVDLMKYMQGIMDSSHELKQLIYSAEDVSAMKWNKSKNQAIVSFHWKTAGSEVLRREVSELFDIRLTAEFNNHNIRCTFAYNNRRINRKAIKQLSLGLQKLSRKVSQQFTDAAAAKE